MSEAVFTRIAVTDARAGGLGFRPSFQIANDDGAEPVASPVDNDRYAEGYEAGLREAGRSFQAKHDQLLALIASADALMPEPSEELAVLIGETVERLVTQIVGDAAIRRDWLYEQATRAAALIGECDQARTIWFHPADLELLADAQLPLEARADPEAERGSIRIDCSSGWIESGVALNLDTLRAQLGLERARA